MKNFVKEWLRSYYAESNKLDCIEMTNDEFAKLIDNELKKVLINMIMIRLIIITHALFFIFMKPDKISVENAIDYVDSIYSDYLKKKDKHLKLIYTLQ